MFPRPDYCPTCLDEPSICIGVAFSVPFDLCRPVLRICDSSRPPVLWAAMPEASIDIDRDLRATEDNVCPAPQASEGRAVNAITETRRVQEPTDRHLRLSVTRPLHLHSSSHARRARIRIQGRFWPADTHTARRSAVAAPCRHGIILACGGFSVSGRFAIRRLIPSLRLSASHGWRLPRCQDQISSGVRGVRATAWRSRRPLAVVRRWPPAMVVPRGDHRRCTSPQVLVFGPLHEHS